jgi:hypothetical protein
VPALGEDATDQPDVLDELSRNPRPSVSRAAIAARHPGWGAATLSLLVIGLVVGFGSLQPLAAAVQACAADPGKAVCVPRVHATVVALPTAAMILGLTASLAGGRLMLKLRRSPLPAAAAGWALFVAGVTVAYLLAGPL